ncbi:protein disulfide-isomerase-like [Octopus sinensis]|uniref:Protein disulfide-isomerase-like n=1 Tax=Octopus sinensis TaxID=2607531 RepID=A0A7E6EHQ4_9MOLL|nr:protein disulfide-isomerase-like [Octopus sinensis]
MFSMFFLVTLFVICNQSPVEKLEEDNFTKYISENKYVLVKFYAPWCGHCKSLAPEYVKAAEKSPDLGVKVAEVDCTEETELCQTNGIKGYPVIKLFTNGIPITYEELSNLTSGSFIVGYFPVLLILILSQDTETQDFQEFKTASMSGDLQFVYEDKKTIRFSGEITSEAVDKFIDDNYIPDVVWLTRDNMKYVFKDGLKVVVFCVNSTMPPILGFPQVLEEAVNTVDMKVSNRFQAQIQFVIIDAINPDFVGIIEFFGFSKIPSFGGVYLNGSISKFFPTDDSFEKDNIVDFADKFLNNKLESNSFIFIDAPWCGHCKKLMPIWDHLASSFESNDGIIIAKTDATKNEYDFDIQKFPTLVFFPKSAKSFETHSVYTGDRKLNDLVGFVKSMSSSPSVSFVVLLLRFLLQKNFNVVTGLFLSLEVPCLILFI